MVPLCAVGEGVIGEVPQRHLQLPLDAGHLGHPDQQLIVLEQVGELSGVDAHAHRHLNLNIILGMNIKWLLIPPSGLRGPPKLTLGLCSRGFLTCSRLSRFRCPKRLPSAARPSSPSSTARPSRSREEACLNAFSSGFTGRKVPCTRGWLRSCRS